MKTVVLSIVGVTIGAQALGNFGVEVLAAHLFVFYYAVLADLTPPDALHPLPLPTWPGPNPWPPA